MTNIHTLEEFFRVCLFDFKGTWDDHLPLIEFPYNNSYVSNIEISPYEALYGHRCRSLVSPFEIGEEDLIGPDSLHYVMKKLSSSEIDL